jgi:hypothetical protein
MIHEGDECTPFAVHTVTGRRCPMTGIAEAGAKSLLDQDADVLVQGLLGFALYRETPNAVALNAIHALDRAEVIGPETIDVAIGQHTDGRLNRVGVTRGRSPRCGRRRGAVDAETAQGSGATTGGQGPS